MINKDSLVNGALYRGSYFRSHNVIYYITAYWDEAREIFIPTDNLLPDLPLHNPKAYAVKVKDQFLPKELA